MVDWLLAQEHGMGLNTAKPYRDFEERVSRHLPFREIEIV